MGAAQSFPDRGCSINPNPAVTPSHGKAVCNATGPLDSSANYATLVTANWEQCRNLCLRRQPTSYSYDPDVYSDCAAFWFQPSTGLCTLSAWDLYSGQFSNYTGKDAATYYSSRCFTCPSACPQQVGANLLDNPGFEYSDTLFGPFVQDNPFHANQNATFGTIAQHGSNSQRSLHMPTTYETDLYQAWNGCSNTLYSLSFDYQFQQCNGSCSPLLELIAGDAQIESRASQAGLLVTNGSWATYRTYLYASAPVGQITPITSSFQLSSTGYDTAAFNLYVDNFQVSPINKSLQPPASAVEMIQNGGFETGKIAPWTGGQDGSQPTSGTVVRPGLNGTQYALSITGTGAYSLQVNVPSFVIGAEYLLSYDFKTTNATTIDFSVGEQYFNWNFCGGTTSTCSGTVRRPFYAQYSPGYVSLETKFSSGPSTTTLLDNISIKRLS